MGRILEALKKSPRLAVPGTDRPFLHTPGPDSEPLEGQAGLADPVNAPEPSTEEVPFIEVGPNRSMEASPSVLASTPPNYGPRLAVGPGEAPARKAENLKGQASQPTPEQDEVAPMPRKLPERALDAVVGSVAGVEVPRPRLAPELIAYYRPDHAISQQYRRLLAPLLSVAPESRSQVLLFTAARPGSGTTTVLLNVALTAAAHGHRRVVVVDGNLRRPALADKLGLGAVAGLRDVLGGTCSLEQALRETDQRNLFALTAGMAPAWGGVRFVVETVRSLLRQLRQRFDLVLVDGPRWDGQPDVVLLGAACDAVYLVVPESEAESSQIDDLYQAIPGHGLRLAGCILVNG